MSKLSIGTFSRLKNKLCLSLFLYNGIKQPVYSKARPNHFSETLCGNAVSFSKFTPLYLVFPQDPFVCSPHAQDSRLMECALSSPHETVAFICLSATTKKSNYRLPLLLSIFRFQVQFEYNITMHLILSHYTMILL